MSYATVRLFKYRILVLQHRAILMHFARSLSIPNNNLKVVRTYKTGAVQRMNIPKRRPATVQRKQAPKPRAAAVAYSSPARAASQPRISSSGNGLRIAHRECIGTISVTGTPLEIKTYNCNPGIPALFPWLAPIANRFESYKFRSLTFHYRTMRTTAEAGNVYMCFDFDANDDPPRDMVTARNYADGGGDSVWQHSTCRLALATGDKLPDRKTRVGIPHGAYDIKSYDIGNFYVLTEGIAANTIGYIEVEYVVDLFKSQQEPGVGGALICGTGCDATHCVGTAPAIDANANLPFTVSSTSTLTFTQQFEGVVTFILGGTGLGTDFAANASGYGAGVSAPYGQVANAGATASMGFFTVRAYPGSVLTPTVTATTLTLVRYLIASGPTNAYS